MLSVARQLFLMLLQTTNMLIPVAAPDLQRMSLSVFLMMLSHNIITGYLPQYYRMLSAILPRAYRLLRRRGHATAIDHSETIKMQAQ